MALPGKPAHISFPLLFTIALIFIISNNCYDLKRDRESEKFESSRINDSITIDTISDANDKFEVHFIDVGQGESILVLTPSKTMLIDAGPRDGNVTAYLHSLGITGIDIVIATHPHADHIGGMPEVFIIFPVGEVIDPGVVHSTLTYARYLKLIDSLDIPYTEGRGSMSRDLSDDAFADILHPSNPDETLLNDASIVIRLVLGKVVILLTGDIERKSEEELLAQYGAPMSAKDKSLNDTGLPAAAQMEFQGSNVSEQTRQTQQKDASVMHNARSTLNSHILKVPHHGSFTSSHTAFIKAVRPETSIIMCGLYNSYVNPHRQTLAVLEAAGSQVWRTDMNGHIIVRSDGISYTVDISRDGPLLPALINLNTATLEELQYIIHIGPGRAGQIMQLRPFESVDDLIKVDGIGPVRLEDIKRQNIVVVE